MPMPHKEVPNVSDLISLPSRYYITPVDEVQHQKERWGKYNSSIEESADSMKSAADGAPALDLGTAALQRIVTNMKSINFEDDDKSFKFNPEAGTCTCMCVCIYIYIALSVYLYVSLSLSL